MSLLVVATFASALAAAPAPAAPVPAPATASSTSATPGQRAAELLLNAKKAERELEYPQAKTILVELFSTPNVPEESLIEGHFLAGAIERVLENDTEARLHFLYVLKRRPDYVLAEDAPPKVRNFFELVREEVKAEQKKVELPPPPQPEPTPAPKDASLLGPIVAGIGGVVAIAGVASAVVGESMFAAPERPFPEREMGRTLALAGWAGAAVGVGVGVAGAVLIVTE